MTTTSKINSGDLNTNLVTAVAEISTVNNKVDTINTAIDTLNTKIDTVDTVVDNIYTKVDTEIATINTNLTTVDGIVDSIKTTVEANKTTLSTINTNVSANKTTLATVNTNVSNLNTRLTDKRAGYLDYLANTTYGLNAIKSAINTIDTVVDNIYAKVDAEIATINTNVNSVLSKVNSGLSVGSLDGKIVKSVQRGVISFDGSKLSVSVSISSVNTSKAIIIHAGDSDVYPSSALKMGIYLTLSDSSISASISGNFTVKGTVSWQVIEFY